MSSVEYEKLYNPSYWSKKHETRDAVIKHFIEFLTARSNSFFDSTNHDQDVSYGTKDRQKLDIFYPKQVIQKSVIVYIHGGYWQEGCKEMYAALSDNFTKEGFLYINIGYTLAPQASVHQIIGELENALMYIRTRFPDMKQILIGHSVGAHAALKLSLNEKVNEFIQGVILISGIFDLTPLRQTSINNELNLSETDVRELSFNESFEIPNDIHVSILVGGDESPSFLDMSKRLFGKINNKKLIDYRVVPNEDHFSIIENIYFENSEIYRIITDFVK